MATNRHTFLGRRVVWKQSRWHPRRRCLTARQDQECGRGSSALDTDLGD